MICTKENMQTRYSLVNFLPDNPCEIWTKMFTKLLLLVIYHRIMYRGLFVKFGVRLNVISQSDPRQIFSQATSKNTLSPDYELAIA